MTIIRNKTNPASLKMQKNDIYVPRKAGPGNIVYWENLRSGHIAEPHIVNLWLSGRIASLV